MINGIDVYEEKRYVSKYDPDKSHPTVFVLGLINLKVCHSIVDEASQFEVNSEKPEEKGKLSLRWNQMNYELVRFGLKGVENFNDPRTNQPVKFETISVTRRGKNYNVVTENVLEMIPPVVITELAEQLRSMTHLLEEEAKN
jgi:hypothetical protein